MSKQSQTANPATAAKTPQLKPAPTATQEMVAAPELTGVVGITGPTAFQHGANPLENPNLQRVQRQMVASRIGQIHGNGHLRQMVTFAKQNQRVAPYEQNQSNSNSATLTGASGDVQPLGHHTTVEDAYTEDLIDNEELETLWGENGSTSFNPVEPPPDSAPTLLQRQEEPTEVQAAPIQMQSESVQRELFEDPVKTIRKDVADFAHNIPGYSLLTYVLGRDPISEDAVDRTPTNLVRALLGIIPGGEQIFQNLQESGALQQAFDWLEEQLTQLNLTWEMIKGLLGRAWDAIDLTDALHPIDAFNQKIKPIFLPVLTRLKNFALAAGQKILEFILAGAMKLAGPMGERIMGMIQQLGGAFSEIVKNPLAFLSRLWTSIKTGLGNFVENIGEHLQTGFIGWLTGTVAKMGVRLPAKWDLAGIFSFVMQVLNIDLSQILGRLGQMLGIDLNMFQAKAQELITIYQNEGGVEGLAKYGLTQIIGEEHMHSLMQVFHVFDILRNGEIGKLWVLVKQHLSSLKELIFGQIKEFLIERVVKEGIKWVLSLLDPTLVAQIVKLCQSVYRIFSFFLERAQQILPLVEAVTSSLAAVASGNIGAAAGAIENALSRTLPIAMGFLSSVLIGDITGPVQNILKKAQGMIQGGIDAILNSKPVQMVTGFIKRVIGKITGLIKTGINKVKRGLGFTSEQGTDEEQAVQGVKDGQVGKTVTWLVEGESHRMWIENDGNKATVLMASVEKPVSQQLIEYEEMAEALDDKHRSKIRTLVNEARQALVEVNDNANQLVQMSNKSEVEQSKVNQKDDVVESAEDRLKSLLKQIREELGFTPSVEEAHRIAISSLPNPELLIGRGPYIMGHAGRGFTKASMTRDAINVLGDKYGCHTTGDKDPGARNWVPDHQPPNAIITGGGGPAVRFYPQSLAASDAQKHEVNRYKAKMMDLLKRGKEKWAEGIISAWFWS